MNLSNGTLNFKIPLATVGGRGFSIPLTLNYSSKVWSASMDTALDRQSQPFQAAYADYAQGDTLLDFYQRVGPGWTIGSAPIIFNRIVRINKLPPEGPFGGCYTHTVPKLTVDALFKINSKVTPRVKVVVTDGPPKAGDKTPGPYVAKP